MKTTTHSIEADPATARKTADGRLDPCSEHVAQASGKQAEKHTRANNENN